MQDEIARTRRKVPKLKFLDKLHHAVVYICIGVGVTSFALCGVLGLNYYLNVKPILQEETLRQQKELLKEGAAPVDTPNTAQ